MTSAYRGAALEVVEGGTSVIALFGPLQGGFITNPASTSDQGIAPLLSYTYVEQDGVQGAFNTYDYNKLPTYGEINNVTQTVLVTYLGPPENLYVSFDGPADLVESNTTFILFPGQTITIPPNCANDIWVNAATSGHRFTAIAFQPSTQYPPTLVASAFPPNGPTNVLKTFPSYLYQEYQDDDDLEALVRAYNGLTQEFVDWFNDVNLPVYTLLSGGLLDWIGAGLYGLTRPTLYSGRLHAIGPYDTLQFNQPPEYGSGLIVNDVTNVAVTSDDVYKRIMTWSFYKGDGKTVTTEWIKRRVYRFLYGTNGTDASGTTYLISVVIAASEITITIITGIRKTVNGALYNRSQFNNPENALFNGAQFSLTQYPVPALALQLQEGIATGALPMPYQYTTTCRIGIIGENFA